MPSPLSLLPTPPPQPPPSAEKQTGVAVADIVEIKEIVATEKMSREREDSDVLDTVIETQGLLQAMVLEHFGSGGEEEEKGGLLRPPRRLPKLEQRMARKCSKNEAAAAAATTGFNDANEQHQNASEGGSEGKP